MPDPLALPADSWRSRWLQSPRRSGALHRVAEVVWEDADEMIAGDVVAVCGKRGRMVMPGIFSRMGAPRCSRCSARLKLPRGNGAPRNAFPSSDPRSDA